MFVRDNLQNLDVASDSNFPNPKFLLMLVAAVIGPFLLFAIGGSASPILWQSGLVWSLLAASLLLFSAGISLMLFKNKSNTKTPLPVSQNFS